MARSEGITLDNIPLREFLERECVKFGGTAPLKEKDVSVHMLQVIPRLKYHREKFPSLYNIYPELYSLQQRASSLLERKVLLHSSVQTAGTAFQHDFQSRSGEYITSN